MSQIPPPPREPRKKSRSPFPSALRVLEELEVRATKTVVQAPSMELLEISRSIQGLRCHTCNSWSETGEDGWHMTVAIDPNTGETKTTWSCNPCVVSNTRKSIKNTGYSLDGGTVLEEMPFKK